MTAEEIRKYIGSSSSEAAQVFCLREIAAQLAEANELTRKTQELQVRQIELLEKDFAFRSNPSQFVSELKTSLNELLGGGATTPEPTTPVDPAPQRFPRRRH